MNQRRLGILLLVATGVVILIGTASLVVGFVQSSILPIYISIAATVISPLLLVAGVVVLVGSSQQRR